MGGSGCGRPGAVIAHRVPALEDSDVYLPYGVLVLTHQSSPLTCRIFFSSTTSDRFVSLGGPEMSIRK